jgi:hypothetical protein
MSAETFDFEKSFLGRCSPVSVLIPQSSALLLNHPVRSRENIRRDRDADLLGGLKIDH